MKKTRIATAAAFLLLTLTGTGVVMAEGNNEALQNAWQLAHGQVVEFKSTHVCKAQDTRTEKELASFGIGPGLSGFMQLRADVIVSASFAFGRELSITLMNPGKGDASHSIIARAVADRDAKSLSVVAGKENLMVTCSRKSTATDDKSK